MRARQVMLFWFVLLAASGAGAEERKLLVSGIFADSSIVGPLLRFSKTDPASTDYVITLLGRTLDGQWVKHLSPKHAFVASADLTPVNAHFSDRIYVDGERMHDLEYEAASYRLRAGFRLTPNDRSTTEIHLVGLIEEVDGLQDGAVTAFWDEPFVGLDLSHAYQVIAADRPLVSSFDGLAVNARVEFFTGEEAWSRATVSQRAGRQMGKVHVRESLLVVTGKSLNVVNRFLVGGSWDALGESALYGYRYGEFRVARGVIANAGADYGLPRNWQVGVRGSYLRSDVADVFGVALNVSKTRATFGFNMGVGMPQSRNGDSEPVFYLAVIAPLYAKGIAQ